MSKAKITDLFGNPYQSAPEAPINDEYVPQGNEPMDEEHYWNTSWGVIRKEIVHNISKFYAPINVNGAFRIKHDAANGEVEFLKKGDFLDLFISKRIMINVKTATGTRDKDISIAEMFIKYD